MAKTKVKKDAKGLYVRCDGWIARSPSQTRFKVGDIVKATHPAGSIVYVKPEWDKDLRWDNPNREHWNIDGTSWWHSIEGRGKEAEKLRNWDREHSATCKDRVWTGIDK